MQAILLIGLFFCHFLGDFVFSSDIRLIKAKQAGRPYLPIFIHASLHAVLMGSVLYFFMGNTMQWALLWIFQLVSHFTIDVLKGKMNVWFPSVADQNNVWHWKIFGADQFLHSVVICLMVYFTFN